MAQQFAPLHQLQFGGVVTTGNPTQRPPSSAAKCENFRVMPGNWLRLRSGRTLQLSSSGSFQRFHEFRQSGGGVFNLTQHFDGTTHRWQQLVLPAYTLNNLEVISTSFGWPGAPTWAGICTQRNKVVWYNGLGVRSGGVSQPPLSSWDGTTVRYVGLDAFVQGGGVSASFSAGGGQVPMQFGRSFYVGLYNSHTGHFSNGVLAGSFTGSGANGTIVFTNLTNLSSTFHNATEQGELNYVFYVTNDGGQVPYLLINTNGSGPVIVSIGTSGATLGASSFLLDQTSQMPITNYPPRPMKTFTYANGRIYYALQANSGSGAPYIDFSYVTPTKFLAAVGWSAAADDIQNRGFVGVPEESFPLLNIAYTPNGEDPVFVYAAQDDNRIIVCTHTGTFLIEEYQDGLHLWRTISWVQGAFAETTVVRTPYGTMWMTQNKELVILPPGSLTLSRVSNDYAKLLTSVSNSLPPADYIFDPLNEIDRYQIYIGGSTSVVHDFWIKGQAYTETNQAVDACKSMYDSSGNLHHIITVGSNVYTHEADPSTGVIPVNDAGSEFTATYIGQWTSVQDSSVRKEFYQIDVVGDGASSTQLGVTPLAITWYGDLNGTAGTQQALAKIAQSTTDNAYRVLLNQAAKFWLKTKFVLQSHSADAGATYTTQPQTDGDTTPNIYGAIWEARLQLNLQGANRA